MSLSQPHKSQFLPLSTASWHPPSFKDLALSSISFSVFPLTFIPSSGFDLATCCQLRGQPFSISWYSSHRTPEMIMEKREETMGVYYSQLQRLIIPKQVHQQCVSLSPLLSRQCRLNVAFFTGKEPSVLTEKSKSKQQNYEHFYRSINH